MHVRRLGYALGAEVTGVDLRNPIDDAMIAAIRREWLDHLLLCFPGQDLTKEQLLAFARRFGDLETVAKENADPETPHISVLTERPINGRVWNGYKNGQEWHSDKSYTARPTGPTFINARELPEVGGNTLFANTYMALDALSPAMQRLLEGLSALHDRVPAQNRDEGRRGVQGVNARVADERAGTHPQFVQPVVRVHPETGRKALFVGDRVSQFVGMTVEESRPLADFLNRHAARYEFTYRHVWSLHDVVMWDNRCMLHIALLDYELGHDPRHMMRCAVMGEPSGHAYNALA